MTHRFRVVFTRRAIKNLRSIHSYIQKDSPQNAADMLAALVDAADSLESLPARFEIHISNRNPSRTVHSMSVRPYIVYYRVLESQSVVEIIAVVHGARRQPRRFP